MSARRDRRLSVAVVGHVDHGKSTLIGRLLHETGSLPEGKVDELLESSRRRGVELEWSFALDALQAERDQAVTIDATRAVLTDRGRNYAIIDAPGHRQFIANMLSGAADADAAILVVDAAEGVGEQTRSHAYLLHVLGIEQVVVAVNKMDAVEYQAGSFEHVARESASYLTALGISARAIVPICARQGDNLATRSNAMPWYTGPTILDALAQLEPPPSAETAPLRMRVQDVYRQGAARVAVGKVESGSLSVGDSILISPIGAAARVKSIERWPSPGSASARAGESIGITLDRPIYVERGDLISDQKDAPDRTTAFAATFYWLAEEGPGPDEIFRLQLGPTEARVSIDAIERVIDTQSIDVIPPDEVRQYVVVEASMRSSALLPLDVRATNAATSRCVLLRGSSVVAAGFVTRTAASHARSANVQKHDHLVSRGERAFRNGHGGAVIWLTGLPGAGKSTLAMAVERRLFARGCFVYVLDGDNIRSGLNSDLGFSPQDRTENIRRVGEVAALFADSGAIVITAFISPFAKDRETARAAAGTAFHEIFLKADLATCESRDPKGLYKRARAGEIPEFTGVSAPYEPPQAPELIVDTAGNALEACVEELVSYILAACLPSAPTPVTAG